MDWRNRSGEIESLAVGDMFHAVGPTGGNLICLVTFVTDGHIQARTVASQIPLNFDRRTGNTDASRTGAHPFGHPHA